MSEYNMQNDNEMNNQSYGGYESGNMPYYNPYDNGGAGDGGDGRKPEKKKKKHPMKGQTTRKAGLILLSALLFGGAAGGAYAGVAYALVGSKQTASQETDTQETDAQETEDSQEEESRTTLQTTSSSDATTTINSIDVSSIVENVMPSIVSITNKSVEEVQNMYSMFGMGETTTQEVESCGSGIIIGQNDTELLIVTNNHVVEGAEEISVGFIDNQVYEATTKGTDSDNDLAVIAVNLSDISDDTMNQIKIAEMGDSDSLKVGEQVVAIGNALGYGQSVTTGIVSAKNRQLEDLDSEDGFLQTDAAINPGNSGGALLNMQGQVIGINSAKLSSTEVEGMGYAIPINSASPIIEELMNRETRTKVSSDQASSLGIKGQTVSSDVSEAYGIPEGVYVSAVTEGSAADNAGITAGCVITKFDGTSVDSIDTLKEQLTYYAAGETVDVVISVANNGEYEEETVSVTLDKAQTTDTQDSQSSQDDSQSGQNNSSGSLRDFFSGFGMGR